MDPQLLMPSPATDFHFDSTTTSPYATAPSSPKIFSNNFFYSAPTSPTHFFHHHLSNSPIQNLHPNQNHHHHEEEEEEEGEGKQDDIHIDMDMDFAFDFSGQLERPSISDADELFHGGKIKPLDPPLRLSPESSPGSYNKKHVDNFSEAFRRTPRDQTQNPHKFSEAFRRTRGRERTTNTTTTTTARQKSSRSLSPMRVSDIVPHDGHGNNQKVSTNQSFLPFGFMWYNKWNLKNLLLFRSTSEGSAATIDDRLKSSSFRSNDGGGGGGSGSVGGSSRRMMKRKVSAHEIHYTANRAAAEEMRRKTSLPYKSGLLGCLGFHHEISRGRR